VFYSVLRPDLLGSFTGVLQCVAVCCSVLQCVAACYSVLQPDLFGSFTNALQRVTVHCSVLQRVAALQCVEACCSVLQRVAACCSVLKCICSVLQPNLFSSSFNVMLQCVQQHLQSDIAMRNSNVYIHV